MNDNCKIVSNSINYAISNESVKLTPKVNDNITLTDYQFFTAKYFILNNYLKSLLCFYETGKGKTLLALYIIKNLFRIYDDWKIILLCKASLIETPWKTSLQQYYPELIDNIKIFSFEENNLNLKLSSLINASSRIFIIIDELHIFISRCISKDVGDKRILLPVYKKVRESILKGFANKLLLLSATPIVNNPDEFIFIYNLLNPYFITDSVRIIENNNLYYEEELTKGLLGKVSYIKSSDVASFEDSERTDRMVGKKINFIYTIPTDYQEKLYLKIDRKEKSLSSRGFRIKRNLACQFVYDGMENNYDFNVETWIPADEKELETKSIKFFKCCQMLKNTVGKVLVFESFIEYGINIFKKYLDFYDISYRTFTGEDQTLRYKSLEEFEDISNKEGKIIKVFLISAAAKEGLSFTYVTDMFILTSSWNEASLSQIIGRSIRLDSHKNSNIDHVNIYFLQLKLSEGKVKTADEEIFEIMIGKFKIFNKMYNIYKLSSIEYISEVYKSNELSIVEFQTLYYAKINEDNKTKDKFQVDKNVEVIYYSFDKNCKKYYLGYRNENEVYNEHGIKIGIVIKPEIYKIVDKKLITVIEIW
jgi:superfamily II DNA or RNA helicase